MSPEVARNGHERRAGECPLLEEERKSRLRPLTSESDPTATLGRPNDNALDAGFLAIKVFVLAAKIPSPEEWVSAVRSSAKQNIVLA
jgi:hypothetical protein